MENFTTGQKDVATPLTSVVLGSGPVPHGVNIIVKAKDTNTGRISVGNSAANAKSDSGVCFTLGANQFIGLDVDDQGDVWLDATVGGEGVEFFYERQFTLAS